MNDDSSSFRIVFIPNETNTMGIAINDLAPKLRIVVLKSKVNEIGNFELIHERGLD